MKRDIYSSINPLDHRYASKEGIKELEKYLSENAKIEYQLKVEEALVRGLAERGICDPAIPEEINSAAQNIEAEEVYREEKKTKHNIRALVNCLQRRVSKEARPYIHLTATSSDIIDTANALRFKEASRDVIQPALRELEEVLINLALEEKETLQTGRTHGQHAVPITFGFALSEYISRIGGRLLALEDAAENLRGQLSGAVGAYNAMSLIIDDPIAFERQVLKMLDLKPATHSTQIVEPEYILDFMHSIISCFGVLANLSDDMRHLQRTEIAEVGEYFAEDQVGSSTMPHKQNPINYENVKSMWKEFSARMGTRYQDQISEHQRDLTNSASTRFLPDILAGFHISVKRLKGVLEKCATLEENMRSNFQIHEDLTGAEPLYILLAFYGHTDAHEAVRQISLKAREKDKSLSDLVKERDDLKEYWQQFTPEQKCMVKNPARYRGKAADKTEEVAKIWKDRLKL